MCKICISYFFCKNSNRDTNLVSNILIEETAWCNMCSIIVFARAKQCSNKTNFTFICQNSTWIFRSGKFWFGPVKYCSSPDRMSCKIVLPLRSLISLLASAKEGDFAQNNSVTFILSCNLKIIAEIFNVVTYSLLLVHEVAYTQSLTKVAVLPVIRSGFYEDRQKFTLCQSECPTQFFFNTK